MSYRLYFTAFVGGLVSLALELSASRLLEPFFGTSNLVWAAVIGLILLFLAVGYELGGRWADRSPQPATLYTLLTAAGLAVAAVPFLARPVLLLAGQGFGAWNIGLVVGSFIAVLALFTVPVTLLACVSPFVIRLALRDVQLSGITAGRVYAVSTAGSFLGTYLPVLVLIPAIGTRRTFLLLALLTTAVGLWGLWTFHRRRFWGLVWTLPVLLVLLLGGGGPLKPQAGLIHEEESAYNFIQVVQDEQGRRYLYLNEGQGIHSVYTPGEVLTGGTWDYFLIAPFFNPPPYAPARVDNLLVIGLAAGTIPAQYTAVYGPLPMDGVEIDPAIVQAGRDYFGMTEPNLHVYTTDGRYFLSQTATRYDVIGVDAYRLPYIPWHLTTVEFFQQVREHLTDEGVLVINVGHTPNDWRLVQAMEATLLEVFPSVHVIAVPETFNAIVIATVQPTEPGNLAANYPLLENVRLQTMAVYAHQNLISLSPAPPVFTDDRAPLEQLTNDLVLRYLLQGG